MIVEAIPVIVGTDAGQQPLVHRAPVLPGAESIRLAPDEIGNTSKPPMPRQLVCDFLASPRQRPKMQMAPLGIGECADRQVHNLLQRHCGIGQLRPWYFPRWVEIDSAETASGADKLVQVVDATARLRLQVF